ncbi:MAG: hypothetical protein M0R16_05420 [Bacteroidales bacterium]|nr:hypothetical protein [Bacteroidales bacterium]
MNGPKKREAYNTSKEYVRHHYISYEGKFELYQLFIEKCLIISNHNKSFISLITPQTWLSIIQATKLRKLVLSNFELSVIVFLGKNVFEDASVDTIIFSISVGKSNNEIKYLHETHLLNDNADIDFIGYSSIDKNSYVIPLYINSVSVHITSKINTNSITLDQIGIWSDGIKIVGDAKDFAFQCSRFDNTFYPMLIGKDIEKYIYNWGGIYCCRNKEEIERHNASDIRLRDESMFQRNKILVRKTGNEIVATIDKNKIYYEQSLFSFGVNDETKFSLEFILAILNSSTADFLLKSNSFSKKETFPQIRIHWLKEFPLKNITIIEQAPFIEKADIMLSLNKELQELKIRFTKLLSSKYTDLNITNKLADWTELDFKAFIKELEKQKIKLSLPEQAEWLDYFEKEKAKAQEIKAVIDKTDKEIDSMVYQLYGLTDEEIRIVEEM